MISVSLQCVVICGLMALPILIGAAILFCYWDENE